MPFEVSPDSLRGAAGVLAALPDEIDRAPHRGMAPNADKLNKPTTLGDPSKPPSVVVVR